MALTLPAPAARSAGALVLITVLSGAVAGCDPNGPGSKQTFNDTEKVKVTEVVIDGGDGAVAVHASPINETRITRVVQSHESDVGTNYRLDGTVLHVDTTCGFRCDVSYDINTPVGVKVRGELSSGNVNLTDVAGADVKVSSGRITVTRATGDITAAVTSGDLIMTDVRGTTRLTATSGEVTGRGLRGPVNVEVTSGDVDLELATPASVTARANSGDVQVGVPAGPYRLDVTTKSGDENVGITATSGAPNLLDVSADSGNVTIRQL